MCWAAIAMLLLLYAATAAQQARNEEGSMLLFRSNDDASDQDRGMFEFEMVAGARVGPVFHKEFFNLRQPQPPDATPDSSTPHRRPP